MTTNHWHSPKRSDFGNNEINEGLKVREFRAHGQEEKIYRVCCETSCQ